MDDRTIEVLLAEERRYPPPEGFRRRAHVSDPEVLAEAERDPEGFWARAAAELHWYRPWERVLEWDPPNARWFVGGKTNLCVNCVDRHLQGPRKTKAAIVWEGEPGDARVLTYWDLHREVGKCANALRQLGVQRGTG